MHWLDAPEARTSLAHRELPTTERAWLEQWIDEGWFVADGLLDDPVIRRLNDDADAAWTASRPRDGLMVLGAGDDDRPDLSHGELVALEPEERSHRFRQRNWRIHGFQKHSAAADRVFRSRALERVASLILARPARPIASINFSRGSQQPLHQDMAVFHIHPRNRLVGAWIALEDVQPESGPFVYHPGSHRTPMFPEFVDYPQTNLRTADPDRMARYNEWVAEQANPYPEALFYGQKGQVLFWHGMLIHGGSAIANPASTRRSMVVHYSTWSADRSGQVRGPFNW